MGELSMGFQRASITLEMSGVGPKNKKNLTFANAVGQPTKADIDVFKAAIEAFTGGAIEVTYYKPVNVVD